jgi:hypothetical protein
VRYEAVNAMLLNEFLLQEVSAQMEATKPSQQVVDNNR